MFLCFFFAESLVVGKRTFVYSLPSFFKEHVILLIAFFISVYTCTELIMIRVMS